jgi:2-polyprenyl-3-methyl-5-hydroxy-6-metoxy-1,4-benzoquinol methylase
MRAAFLERTALFRGFGYDRLGAPRFLLDHAGPLTGPVLDVGAGQGVLAIEIARRGLRVVGVDLDGDDLRAAAVNAAAERVEALTTFVRAAARHVPCAEGAFGAAIAMDALHHLDEGAAVFAEMVRVVAPGGRIVVSDFNDEGFALVARVYRSQGQEHEVGPVTVASATAWFLEHGLEPLAAFEGYWHSTVVFGRPGAA